VIFYEHLRKYITAAIICKSFLYKFLQNPDFDRQILLPPETAHEKGLLLTFFKVWQQPFISE